MDTPDIVNDESQRRTGMARGVNKVTLIGNLGADPEMKYTAGGTAICKFRIATTEKFKDREGNQQERTEWHRIVAWAKLAEICGQYLSKGKQVYIEGSLRTSSWDDNDGNKRYMTEVNARDVQFLSGGNGQGNGAGQGDQGGGGDHGAPPAGGDYGQPPMGDDDIPF
jgi:single-strand DNA-binding protein